MTTISVVIPARNRAAVIGRAIESVKTQSFRPMEIIVVDDGSDDDGATVAAVQAQMDGTLPIHLITLEKRGGAPRARNIGAGVAKGEWIALLDSDDAWDPEKLREQVKLIDDDVGAVFTDTLFENPGGQRTTKFAGQVIDPADLVFTNCLGGCSAALIRREAFDAIGGFDESLPSCQDWDLWIKLHDHGGIRVSPLPLTLYYFDGNERISRNVQSVVKGHESLYARIIARMDEGSARKMRRFQSFHLAQTKVYFANTARGAFAPALLNLINPHPRTLRRSSLHLLWSGLKLKMETMGRDQR
ncbi:glycosyltransferase family 2 protein [Sphingobium chlorophenolicum]|uniref:Glycosyl transferase family 2 n=1 Tax=Sphingobium chlorophenolicum TaxID=46429 RepID=A0A081RGC1_SPHCR|nr:glycosyltransferase family A protein [Sphingobium chlorophenolicum]KEQ54244.1 Glycosyl transferase family 2 [Sphingobium chlorophenolicum]